MCCAKGAENWSVECPCHGRKIHGPPTTPCWPKPSARASSCAHTKGNVNSTSFHHNKSSTTNPIPLGILAWGTEKETWAWNVPLLKLLTAIVMPSKDKILSFLELQILYTFCICLRESQAPQALCAFLTKGQLLLQFTFNPTDIYKFTSSTLRDKLL